jgi:hypothetical protein
LKVTIEYLWEVEMLYMDDLVVKAWQDAREIELERACENYRLLQGSRPAFTPITWRLLNKVGDSLIRIGRQLKVASGRCSEMWVAASDADCRESFS